MQLRERLVLEATLSCSCSRSNTNATAGFPVRVNSSSVSCGSGTCTGFRFLWGCASQKFTLGRSINGSVKPAELSLPFYMQAA